MSAARTRQPIHERLTAPLEQPEVVEIRNALQDEFDAGFRDWVRRVGPAFLRVLDIVEQWPEDAASPEQREEATADLVIACADFYRAHRDEKQAPKPGQTWSTETMEDIVLAFHLRGADVPGLLEPRQSLPAVDPLWTATELRSLLTAVRTERWELKKKKSHAGSGDEMDPEFPFGEEPQGISEDCMVKLPQPSDEATKRYSSRNWTRAVGVLSRLPVAVGHMVGELRESLDWWDETEDESDLDDPGQ